MKTLAPVEVLRLDAGGHEIVVTGRPAGWPTYFTPEQLGEFKRLEWAVRRARLNRHERYLTATRVFVGAYTAAEGGEEIAQRNIIARVTPTLRAAGIDMPDPVELAYESFAAAPAGRLTPGFLTPKEITTATGVVVHSVSIDC